MKKTIVALAFLMAISTVAAHAGVSVEESKVLDRWTLGIGGYLTGLSTDLRLDSQSGREGSTISLEDDLGFSSSEGVPRLRLGVILGKRHQISAGWYKTDRESTTTLQEEINWGDETFPINIDLGGFYKTEFIDVAYTYYFYTSEKTALGVTGGLVLANLSAGIGVRLGQVGVEREEDLSTDIPVPQLGFNLSSYLGHRFVFVAGLGYIAFNLDDWEGSAGSANIGIEHRTWKNFGFGAGYAYSNYDVDTLATDFLGKFEYTIDGFQFFARAAW